MPYEPEHSILIFSILCILYNIMFIPDKNFGLHNNPYKQLNHLLLSYHFNVFINNDLFPFSEVLPFKLLFHYTLSYHNVLIAYIIIYSL
jgi:hypothetical protein